MKKAISISSFPPGCPLDRCLGWAKEAGFQGFELELSEQGSVNLHSDPADLQRVRMEVETAGLEVSGLATGLYWEFSATSGDPTIREHAAHVLRRQIECAAGLGVSAILVVPGAVGVDFLPSAEEVAYDLAWERAREFILAALPLAEEQGVRIGVENVWNKFLLSPLEMRAFIDSFESPWVRSWFDVGNVLATGYPEHWIPILGARIVAVHLKDYRRAVGTAAGFVDLLSGDVNWPAVMQALRAIDYHGWLTAEMIPPAPFYKHGPEILVANTSRAMDRLLAFI